MSAQDYFPFGEELRTYTLGGYNKKYLFTEKERDQETSIENENLSIPGYDYFGARYYDSYIGRWLSVDPLADKYPGLSPYNYTLNNPLKYVDPDGNEIKISGDKQMAKNDMLELAGSNNANFVQFADDGKVSLSQGYSVTAGGGSELLSQLVGSNSVYEYAVSTQAVVYSQSGVITPILLDQTGSYGISSAIKGGMQNSTMQTTQPLSGDAQITISPNLQVSKNSQIVPRTHIVFHELKEAQIMVDTKTPRRTSTDGRTSAHGQAGIAGKTRAVVDNLTPNGADGKFDERVK